MSIQLVIGAKRLPGLVEGPPDPGGLVLFAHGSGSSRLSPRNRYVASELQAYGFATLLFDLLTEQEAEDRRKVFDIGLLASRVEDAMERCGEEAALRDLNIGLFGASTGAAAALVAAARQPDQVAAVVSRGGRPDLAGDRLRDVRAPTLLLVGGEDREVLALNEQARAQMRCTTELRIVPGATHLFEEPGTLEAVVEASAAWFTTHLTMPR